MPLAESESIQNETGTVDSSYIIVIQPGSKYLRIGRATDQYPKTILHAVARKRTKAALKVKFGMI